MDLGITVMWTFKSDNNGSEIKELWEKGGDLLYSWYKKGVHESVAKLISLEWYDVGDSVESKGEATRL